MSLNIEWNDFRNTEPPRLNEWYIVEDTGGNVYLDRWIKVDSWCGPTGEYTIRDRWEGTHNAYVERWAEIGDMTLRQYIGLREEARRAL